MLSLMVLTSCGSKCPKKKYPPLELIEEVPKEPLEVKDSRFTVDSTIKARNIIRTCYLVDDFYRFEIQDYRTRFLLKDEK